MAVYFRAFFTAKLEFSESTISIFMHRSLARNLHFLSVEFPISEHRIWEGLSFSLSLSLTSSLSASFILWLQCLYSGPRDAILCRKSFTSLRIVLSHSRSRGHTEIHVSISCKIEIFQYQIQLYFPLFILPINYSCFSCDFTKFLTGPTFSCLAFYFVRDFPLLLYSI